MTDALAVKADDAAEDASNNSMIEDSANRDPELESYAPKISDIDWLTPAVCMVAASFSSNTLALADTDTDCKSNVDSVSDKVANC
jgi:hypothetical protein